MRIIKNSILGSLLTIALAGCVGRLGCGRFFSFSGLRHRIHLRTSSANAMDVIEGAPAIAYAPVLLFCCIERARVRVDAEISYTSTNKKTDA